MVETCSTFFNSHPAIRPLIVCLHAISAMIDGNMPNRIIDKRKNYKKNYSAFHRRTRRMRQSHIHHDRAGSQNSGAVSRGRLS